MLKQVLYLYKTYLRRDKVFKSKCRIMYITPIIQVGKGSQLKQAVQFVLDLVAVIVFVGVLWASFWVICAIDDVCFASNVGGLV